jgi:hypothetical protein
MTTDAPPRWLEYLDLDSLKPAPRNPKAHDAAGIGASVARFGVIEVQVMDERTGRLVSGHGRLDAYKAARDGGEDAPEGVRVDGDTWMVPVLRGWRSKNRQDADAALIGVNRLIELGGWNQDELVGSLTTVASTPAGFVGVGFGQTDLDKFAAALGRGGAGVGDSIGDKAAGYAGSGVRSFVLDYPVVTFDRLSRLAVELRRHYGHATNGVLAADLVERACAAHGVVLGGEVPA